MRKDVARRRALALAAARCAKELDPEFGSRGDMAASMAVATIGQSGAGAHTKPLAGHLGEVRAPSPPSSFTPPPPPLAVPLLTPPNPSLGLPPFLLHPPLLSLPWPSARLALTFHGLPSGALPPLPGARELQPAAAAVRTRQACGGGARLLTQGCRRAASADGSAEALVCDAAPSALRQPVACGLFRHFHSPLHGPLHSPLTSHNPIRSPLLAPTALITRRVGRVHAQVRRRLRRRADAAAVEAPPQRLPGARRSPQLSPCLHRPPPTSTNLHRSPPTFTDSLTFARHHASRDTLTT